VNTLNDAIALESEHCNSEKHR
jgi:hypothetical protein